MKTKTTRLLFTCLALLLPFAASAQSFAPRDPLPDVRRPGGQKLLRISMAVLAAATAADAATSWNRLELNPVLQGSNGRFGAKGMSLKFGLAGSAIALQWMVAKKAPQSQRSLGIGNLALSGILTGVAVHNYRLPR